MTTPAQYVTGSLKQDPVSKAVAVRASVPTTDGTLDWAVMTVNYGGHYAPYADVQNWTDIPNTPVPSPGS
jgi:hypothetical protein